MVEWEPETGGPEMRVESPFPKSNPLIYTAAFGVGVMALAALDARGGRGPGPPFSGQSPLACPCFPQTQHAVFPGGIGHPVLRWPRCPQLRQSSLLP